MPKLFSLLPAFVSGLLLSLIGSCTIPNPNHCFNITLDTNAWCAAVYPDDKPYCSPCAADNYGCVANEPDPADCPAYTPDESGTAGTETAGTETAGTETAGTETAGTETASTETATN